MTGGTQTCWPIWLPRRPLTIEETADLLRVDTRTVRRMLKDGRLAGASLGRLVRVWPESVLVLLCGE
jgi:excisionase family DNA binding protein